MKEDLTSTKLTIIEKTTTIIIAIITGKIRAKEKNMRRANGNNHEWKYCYLNPISKKIKNEENQNVSDDDYSESSSYESMYMMNNEADADSEPEESFEDTCTSEKKHA